MQPLTPTQIKIFIQAHLREREKFLLHQVRDEKYKQFAQVPLFLEILCRVFEENGTIPSNLGLILREFTRKYDDNLKGEVLTHDESETWWPDLGS